MKPSCLKLGVIIAPLAVPGLPARAGEWTAIDFEQKTIYHSPQHPGYTAWCTLWRARDGHLRLAFQQVTGPVEKPEERTNVTVILDSPDEAATWKVLREALPRKNLAPLAGGIYAAPGDSSFCGHGLAALPDGTLVTGLWAGGGIDTGYVQRSEDDGATWSAPIFLLDPVKFKTWPTALRRLRDGRLILVAGVWEREAGKPPNPRILKAMFQSRDEGRTWGPPVWLLPASVGVCEESDFAELDTGELLFVHRTEHFDGEKYLSSDRWQGLVRPRGQDWEVGPPSRAPFPHSGFPELLKARDGVILHVATDGVWWTAGAGARWEKLPVPGSPYYPRAAQLADGRILVVGHRGSDDAYGSVDQAIVQQTFRLKRQPAAVESTARGGRMKLLSKEVFVRHQGKRPPAAGFVAYVSGTKPQLMHCHGWEDYSDGYDDYAVSLSLDNGRTWSEPTVRWKSEVVPDGRIRYAEPAAFFDADREKLIVLVDKVLYPKDKLNVDAAYSLVLDVYDPAARAWSERRELKFPGERPPAMSFSFPIKTSRGRLLFPGMRQTLDASGNAVHYKGCWAPVDEMVTVIGEWKSGGDLAWRLGKPLQINPEVSSRGLSENALAELRDGSIAAICRGDNSMFPEKPGTKWLSFSRDGGETWSPPDPLPATGGDPIESGANGSALFRSVKNGRLYWMGNLALRGERARDNWPRSPLVIAEVEEEPFALKRDTIFAVDERTYNDSPRVQLSNFRFYQDRETGDLVIFLTRYGEHSEKDWMIADYYRYRVELP
ncbi:MAG: exo-alpha-sialidase [Planctomycetes bacterium]|nr:exo-alpha-sialidase [Planctomycetota bacterium]